MQVFKLKQGGVVENPNESIVIMNRPIDSDLIQMAINKVAGNSDGEVSESAILKYIEDNFKSIYVVEKDLQTFYY